jgi:hypothetical protein
MELDGKESYLFFAGASKNKEGLAQGSQRSTFYCMRFSRSKMPGVLLLNHRLIYTHASDSFFDIRSFQYRGVLFMDCKKPEEHWPLSSFQPQWLELMRFINENMIANGGVFVPAFTPMIEATIDSLIPDERPSFCEQAFPEKPLRRSMNAALIAFELYRPQPLGASVLLSYDE